MKKPFLRRELEKWEGSLQQYGPTYEKKENFE